MKRFALIPVILLVLSACQQPAPTPPRYPMPRYDHLSKIPVNAAELRVVRQYQSPQSDRIADARLPVKLIDAAEQWMRDRVELTGTSGILVFTITDAGVTETKLPRTYGMKGMFTTDNVARYDARLTVIAERVGTDTAQEPRADAKVSQSRTMSEKLSLEERDQFFYKLMQDVITKFDSTMEPQLRTWFRLG